MNPQTKHIQESKLMNERRIRLPIRRVDSPDIQLRIVLDRDEYIGWMQIGHNMWEKFPIYLTRSEVDRLNQELQHLLDEAGTIFDPSAGPGSKEWEKEILQNLIEKGRYAFNAIFSEHTVKEKIRSATNTRGTNIQFCSERFDIPWELLYSEPLGTEGVRNFWGIKHILSRTIIRNISPGGSAHPRVRATNLGVGVVSDSSLPNVERELEKLKTLSKTTPLTLSLMRPLDPEARQQSMNDLQEFSHRNNQIMHFACHAIVRPHSSQSVLHISEDFDLSTEDLVANDLQLSGYPFIILNACKTGVLLSTDSSNWATQFWQRGAIGVLATEFDVPDAFAANFIIRFYRYLLQGRNVGSGLRSAREDFWVHMKNPLGLGYALYSPPDVSFELPWR